MAHAPETQKSQPRRAHKSPSLKGTVVVPGDKSISQRALILSGMAEGESRISGLLESEDVLNTAGVVLVGALGATVNRSGEGAWRVRAWAWVDGRCPMARSISAIPAPVRG